VIVAWQFTARDTTRKDPSRRERYDRTLLAMAAPMNRFIEPAEVASVMMFLCSSEASAMTGQAINVTGGFLMI